jgi:hypothetical protein
MGKQEKKISSNDLVRELKKNNIDFYILWGNSDGLMVSSGY